MNGDWCKARLPWADRGAASGAPSHAGSRERLGIATSYAAIFLLAGTGIFAKRVNLPAVDSTLYRSLVAAAVLLFIARVSRVSLRPTTRRDLGVMAVLGALLIVHWVTFFHAMQVSTVAIGMTALYTYPLFTLVVNAVAARRAIATRDALLVVLVLGGIYVIAPVHLQTGPAAAGMAWGIVSAALFAIRNVAQRLLLAKYPAICSVFYQSLFGGLLLVPFASTNPWTISGVTWGGLAMLGAAFTAAPHTLLATSLRYLDAKTVAFIGCLQPVLGAAMAAVLIDEWPAWNVIVGASVILGCAAYETKRAAAPAPR